MADTAFEAFMTTAQAAPDDGFLCAPAPGCGYHPDGLEFTYAQTRMAVLALREVYAAGYGHGSRVALLLTNPPEFFFHYLALNALGVGLVPINPDYRHDAMLYQMESEADPAVVITTRVEVKPLDVPVIAGGVSLPVDLPLSESSRVESAPRVQR